MKKYNKFYLYKFYLLLSILSISNNIKNYGLNLGENSITYGKGSISTSINGISIGNNSFNTGKSENKESILNKLYENKYKIEEIENYKTNLNKLLNEIKNLEIREKETIEAGIRVEEIRKAKEKAYISWENLKNEYDNKIIEYSPILKEYENKIENLNNRLNALSKIDNINLNSEKGLTDAAIKLKNEVEKDIELDLPTDFYKEYTINYYKSLGDIRKNEELYKNINTNSTNSNLINKNENIISYTNLDSFENIYSIPLAYTNTNYNSKNIENYDFNDLKISLYNDTTNNQFKINLNINTDITTQEEFDKWNLLKDKEKNTMTNLLFNISDGVFKVNNNVKEYIKYVMDMKYEKMDLDYQITYYQYQYEKSHDLKWLDKKKNSIKKREVLINNWGENINSKAYQLFIDPSQNSGYSIIDNQKIHRNLFDYFLQEKLKWKKENIDDIKEKNKITVEKLTNELENALGINKNFIKNKELELNNLKNDVSNLYTNYLNINPSERDIEFSKEYMKVKEKLDFLNSSAKTMNNKITELKELLTLHNINNLGENNISIGADSKTIGNNSISIGKNTLSLGENNINISNNSNNSGNNSITLGNNINVDSNSSVSIGNSIEIISNEDLSISNSIIIGTDIIIDKNLENAVVLGYQSKGISNAFSIGNENNKKKIVFIADGEISENSSDAINGSQLFKTYKNIDKKLNLDLSNLNEEATNKLFNLNKLNFYTKSEIDNTLKNLNNEINNKVIDKSLLNKKLDTDLNNITNDGKTIIKEIISNSISFNDEDPYIKVNKHENNNLNFSINLNKEKLANDILKNIDFNTSTYSKHEIDNKINILNKETSSAIALAISNSNLIDISNKKFNLSASLGYYNKQAAFSIGFNSILGKYDNIGLKISSSISTNKSFSFGAGFSFAFIDTNTIKNINSSNISKEYIENFDNLYNELKNQKNNYDKIISTLIEEIENLKNRISNLEDRKKNNEVKIGEVFFDFDKYLLTDEHKKIIDEIINKNMDKIKSTRYLVLLGNADEIGTIAYNYNLGINRSNEILKYVKEKYQLAIKIFSNGKEYPLYNDDTLNRRVDILIEK